MKRASLIAAAVAHTRRPDPARRRPAPDGLRVCAWEACGETFRPTRDWQIYHADTCRGMAWRRQQARRGARPGSA